MGIVVYARLSGQTPRHLRPEQIEFGLLSPDMGCMIREGYHGEPYVTRFLFREAFVTGEARIGAATLRQRLPEALRLSDHRERVVYHVTSPEQFRLMRHTSFVEYCERLEQATGEPSMIVASY